MIDNPYQSPHHEDPQRFIRDWSGLRLFFQILGIVLLSILGLCVLLFALLLASIVFILRV